MAHYLFYSKLRKVNGQWRALYSFYRWQIKLLLPSAQYHFSGMAFLVFKLKPQKPAEGYLPKNLLIASTLFPT